MFNSPLEKLHAISNISSRLAPLAIAVAAAWVTQPVFGQGHQLVFTENSSSSLSVTYDGSGTGITVVGGGDSWSVTFPQNIFLDFSEQWLEPENPKDVNTTNGIDHAVDISSDQLLTNGFSVGPDGFTFVGIGTDSSDGASIDATFNDLGDTVPDTGTTCSLFGLSLMGLAFLRRKLC